MKTDIESIARKNRIVENIVAAIRHHGEFLVVGHRNPDDDCVGSMVAVGLFLQRFAKQVHIHTAENLGTNREYLIKICRYNSINVNSGIPWAQIGVVFVCDTAAPALLHLSPEARAVLDRADVVVVEVDHHLGTGSTYSGDEGYRLVMEASSTAEIIAYLACKVSKRHELMEEYGIFDMFPRNFVLSVITGLVGDTNLGQYLSSRRVARSYHFYSTYFNHLLRRKTMRLRNFSTQEELFQELGALSTHERQCFDQILAKADFRSGVGYRAMDQAEMASDFGAFGDDTIINTSRAAADAIAEAAGKIGIVAYWDRDETSPYVQCRARRSQMYDDYDLRDLIALSGIENGGGHPGAVGFRVPKDEVTDLCDFIESLVSTIVGALP